MLLTYLSSCDLPKVGRIRRRGRSDLRDSQSTSSAGSDNALHVLASAANVLRLSLPVIQEGPSDRDGCICDKIRFRISSMKNTGCM